MVTPADGEGVFMKTDLPFDLKVTPVGWGNPLMEQAYIDFIRWAVGVNGFIDEFKKDTGFDLLSLVDRKPLEIIIDKTTGYDNEFKSKLNEFIEWLTINHWGLDSDNK